MSDITTRKSSEVKTCTRCGKTKPLSEFYQHKSGRKKGKHWAMCRECDIARGQNYRANNPDNRTESTRRWNEEKSRDRHRERLNDPKYRQRKLENSQRWKKNNPEIITAASEIYRQQNRYKNQARYAVRNAVRRGELPPVWTMVCEDCQEAQAVHWHHYLGYDESHHFDVTALCTSCHGKAHWSDV